MEVGVGRTEYSQHRFLHSSGNEEDLAKVLRRIVTAAEKNLNEFQAEAATVGDAESASAGDNDTSAEDSENLNLIRLTCFFLYIYIACIQVRQCHECYSKSNRTIPELCAAFKKVTKLLYTEEVQKCENLSRSRAVGRWQCIEQRCRLRPWVQKKQRLQMSQ